MKFTEFLKESKRINGIKGTLGKYDDFSGTLKTIIAVETEDDDIADETYTETHIYFEGNTWSLETVNISDKVSHSKFKKEVTKSIEKMLGSRDLLYYFKEDDDETIARSDAEFEIWLDDSVLK